MKLPLFLCVSMALVPLAAPVAANTIERACLQSDRNEATRSLCRCVGSAAERVLDRNDMRTGARFFTDPEAAQRVQLSDTRRDDAFWDRWRAFAEVAEAMCS